MRDPLGRRGRSSARSPPGLVSPRSMGLAVAGVATAASAAANATLSCPPEPLAALSCDCPINSGGAFSGPILSASWSIGGG